MRRAGQKKGFKGYYVLAVLLLAASISGEAQKTVFIADTLDQYIFSFGEIEYLEDPQENLTIDNVISPEFSPRFKPSATFSPPQNFDRESAYWYRIRIHHNKQTSQQWQLEFFDQTIDQIDFYMPREGGGFERKSFGDSFIFGHRGLLHKNFVIHFQQGLDGERNYYFKVKSRQTADILVVLRTQDYFFNYAIDEYFFFGIFYGMILVFCFYNLLMFLAVHERQYLYYILYLMGIGLYEMSADGIAFQYLWPESTEWNQYAPGFFLYLASTASLFFAASLLNLRTYYPNLLKVLAGALIFRTVFLVLSLTVFPDWFYIRFIEFIPFCAAFYCGIYSLLKGYRPARLMVVGYSFLFLGIVIKFIQYLGLSWLPLGELTHYGLGFSFIMEMMFLSFAISDKIKVLRLEKEKAQEKIIEQLHVNQRLKDRLNEELEQQVAIKTNEVVFQAERIKQQNHLLSEANQRLEIQSEEIAAINALLARDNEQLRDSVETVTEARILSRDVDFEEFSAKYPDDESCLKFLGEIKWHHGYACAKCSYTNYSVGRTPYARRCTKCGYDESVTANTLLQNTRLPINKAFYIIFLVYSSKGNISSHKLSEILHIRQSTCWAYSAKIKKVMRGKKSGAIRHEGWDSILLTETDHSSIHH